LVAPQLVGLGGCWTDKVNVLRTRTVICLSILSGVALELGIHALSGRREAWDSPLYWTLGLPGAGLTAVLIGYLAQRGSWLWAAAIIPSQVTTMMVRNGDIGGLWPLMMILASILGVPFVVAAFLGSRFRPRPDRHDTEPDASALPKPASQ
jgi:hypothetical protein